MKLVISQLKPGENPLLWLSEQDSSMKDLKKELEQEGFKIDSSLKFEGTLHNHEPEYYLEGKVDWSVRQDCSRCAESFSAPLSAEFRLALAHQSTRKQEEEENLDVIYFNGPELDLRSLLHEQFILSLPLRAFCSGNCKGICQTCGTNLNKKACQCQTSLTPNPFSILKNLTV